MIHYFFRCTKCGSWSYSNKIIIKKRCLKCRKWIDFKKAIKTKYDIHPHMAPKIMAALKKKDFEKSKMGKYVTY